MELVVPLVFLQHAVNFHAIWSPVAIGFSAVNMASDRKLHFHEVLFSLSLKQCVRCHFVSSFPSAPCCHASCCQLFVVVLLALFRAMPCLSLSELCSPQLWGVENVMWLILADCSDFLFCSQLLNRSSDLIVSYMKLAYNLVQFYFLLLFVCVCMF